MIRKNGGVGQHGHVILEMYGLPREGGFVFENNVKGGEIPSEYLTDIRNGVQEAMQEGVVAGFPVIDVGVTLLGGSYHEVDSSGN
ncbi:elongation factor G, partial [Streptomyces galilaeus]